MVQQRMLLQLTLVGVVIAAMAVQGSARAKQGCQDRCGNVSIPYPFGMTKGCYYNDDFLITCSKNFSTPKPFLWRSNYNIINISIFDGEVNILQQIAHDCYDQLGTRIEYNEATVNLSTMRLSSTKNKFTVIGCDTFAYMEGYQGDKPYLSGCISLCDRMDYVSNGSCSGIGCCQTAIPEGVSFYQVALTSNTNYTSVWKFSPCGYAFVVEEDKFNFSLAILTGLRSETYIPAVLDWVISNETCEVAKKNLTGSYACMDNNSVCYDTTNNAGYRCRCLEGYQGNPYLAGGCQDVDECEDAGLNQCEGVCTNIPGNYTCSCPKGHRGDGRKDGKGCSRHEKLLIYKIGIGIAIGVVVLIMAFSWLYLVHKRRKLFKLKEKFFRQNGGLLLKQKLSQQEGSTETTKIFTAEELEKATDNYADSKIIGKGGFGTVYKGVLKDNIMAVAIKKSKVVDQSQIDQFINEMIVLSQINHRNVVKLLGCCLEESVPLLVYEFIPNSTLHDHIHNERKASLVSWEIRLRIAAETAGVLSYLHSAAVIPIIHRDIKSTNILLDDNYTAKVCDFGVSRLVPLDEMQLSTIVQGTFGYLDPEYMHTSQLTEKSDVYSFGVVLVELLTGKKVVSFNRPEDERCLAMHFLISLKDDRLFEILDDCVVQEGNTEQLKEVAKIARSCLRVKGEERPTMKQVAVELESLRMVGKHPWINEDSEETELLGVASDASGFEGSRNTTTSYDNIKEHIVLPLRSGR